MLRVMHLADLHLGYRPPYLDPPQQAARQAERDRLLERAVDFALDAANRIDLVVIAGDLFDDFSPGEALVQRVIDQLRRIEEHGLPVITVPGNHDDIAYPRSVFRQLQGTWPGTLVTSSKPAVVFQGEVKGVMMTVYSGALSALNSVGIWKEFPRQAFPGFHLGVFHGALDWESGGNAAVLDSDGLRAADYHYTALGHIHQFSVKRVGGGLVAYSGMVEGRSFDDPGVAHWTIAQVSDRKVELAKTPVPTRRHKTWEIDVSTISSWEELLGSCRRWSDTSLLARIALTGIASFPIYPEELQSALGSDFFHVVVTDQTVYVPESSLDILSRQPTIRGQFVQRLRTEMEKARTPRDQAVYRIALAKGLAALGGDDYPHG